MKTLYEVLKAFFFLLSFLFIAPFALLLQSCDDFITDSDKEILIGNGRESEVNLSLNGFNAVQVNTFANVHITQGNSFHLNYIIDENVIDCADIYVHNNTLYIDISNNYSYKNVEYKVNITMPGISELIAHSAGNISLENEITADNLFLKQIAQGIFQAESM